MATVAEAAEVVRAPRTRRRAAARAAGRAASDRAGAARRVAETRPAIGADDAVADLADVRGQADARRALEIALAGGHAMLLIGPSGLGQDAARADDPGAAARPLDDEAALPATIVASVGVARSDHGLVRRPPVPSAAPHDLVRRAWSEVARGCRRAR